MHSDIRPREPFGRFVDEVLTRRTEILTGCRWVEAHLLPRCQGHRPQRQFPVKAGLFGSNRGDDRLEDRTRSGVDEEMCSMTLLDYLRRSEVLCRRGWIMPCGRVRRTIDTVE